MMANRLNATALGVEVRSECYTGDLGRYLKDLLHKLWREGWNFNGKRPWGYSNWKWCVYEALIREGHLPGKLDEDGFIEECDTDEADKLIGELIEHHLFA